MDNLGKVGPVFLKGTDPAYTVAMEGEESSFYSVLQASSILGVNPKKVHELIDQGELEAPYKRAGLRLIRARSVHARPKGVPPGAQASTASAPESPMPTPASVPDEDRGENCGFGFDLLVLVIIGTITLLAAAYTLLPALLGGGSTQPKETAGTANGVPQPDKSIAGPATDPEETTPTTSSAPAGWVSAIGDSVMLGAIDALQQIPNLALVDAQGSRQPPAALDILRQRLAGGQLGDVVVVHVGNNGLFAAEQFDEMMRVLAEVRKVLVVNMTVPTNVPDPIAVPNNAVLTDEVRRYPNAVLVDWQAEGAGHPEFFGEDGIHLTPQEGAQAYAELIAVHLGDDAAEDLSVPPGPKESISWGEGGAFGECVGPSSWFSVPATL